MKSLLFILFAVGCMLTAKSQSLTYKTFKIDFQLGYTFSEHQNTGAGASFTVEPHYSLNDAFAIGLRLEDEGQAYVSGDHFYNLKLSWLSSYCATGEYYLSNSGIRFFVGGGLGFFTRTSLNYFTSETDVPTATLPSLNTLGLFPEAGFEFKHFRLSADYDITANSSSYLAFKAGFFFGGGHK